MKRKLLTLLLSLATLLHTTVARAQWEPIAPLPEPNGGFVAGCVEGKIIIAGGTNWRDDAKHWLDKVWIFDPATGHWDAAPSLSHPLAYAACGSDGKRLYFAGGADGKQARREIGALDAGGIYTAIGELPRGVAFHAGAIHEGRLYVIGGTSNPDDWSKATAEGRAINLRDGKSAPLASLEKLSHGLGIPATAMAGGKFHVFTGAWLDAASQQVHNLSDAFAYDPARNQWQTLTRYPKTARGVAAVALDDHRILLAGGYGTDAEGFLSAAFIYDAATNRYTTAPALPFSATTCLVKCGASVYALGGEDVKKHRSAQCFRIALTAL
jgi:N-acetylneuraminic acid mutarotase